MKGGRLPSPGRMKSPWELAKAAPETPVLLALSGGADSRALLHLLSLQAQRDGFRLLLAHVNHHIRGAESDRDADFCRALAEQYGWELELLDADVPHLAEQSGKGLEETAREVRYQFFERLMRGRNIPLLATAHHADDNLETVLFRICRGTGLRGLCGIPPVREFANGHLTRPLLPFSRKEILAYCEREHLPFVQDSTNADDSYARNRIRLHVVPELEHLSPHPQQSVARMTQALTQDCNFLDEAAQAFLTEHMRDGKLPVAVLQGAHPSIRRRVLAELLPELPETVHLTAMESLIASGKSGTSCSLPGGYRACVQNGWLTVLPGFSGRPLSGGSLCEALPFREGEFRFCDGKLTISVKKIENFPVEINVHNLSTPQYIIINKNSDIILERVYWRCRLPGETLLLRGLHRKLRKLYREAGIPPSVRDIIPLLCDEKGVLWAPFVGVRDDFKPQVEPQDKNGTYQAQIFIRGWTENRKDS